MYQSRKVDSIPAGLWLQDKIWVDRNSRVWNVEDLPDQHLINLMAWIERFRDDILEAVKIYTKKPYQYPVDLPLYRKLEKISRGRCDVNLTNAVNEAKATGGFSYSAFLKSLRAGGYDIVKMPPADEYL